MGSIWGAVHLTGYIGMYLAVVVGHCTCGFGQQGGMSILTHVKLQLYLEHLAIYVDCSDLLSLWLLFHIVVVFISNCTSIITDEQQQHYAVTKTATA